MHVCMHACMDGWMYEYMRKPQSSLNHNDAKAVPEDKHMQKILRELDDGAKDIHTKYIHTYIHTCIQMYTSYSCMRMDLVVVT